jgi:chromosome segregation ATPase
MAKTKEALLSEMQSKVSRLVVLYENCREANTMLSSEIQEVRARLDEKELQYKELEQKYVNLKAARSLGETPESSSDAKQKISNIVREIDQCLALLTQ